MARQKRLNYAGIIIAVLVIVVLSAIGFQAFNVGGATIFSIDNVETYGNKNSTEWVIALSMNQGAESVKGEITTDDLAKYNLAVLPATNFKIEFNLANPSCEYDIVKDNNEVGELYYAFVNEECLANVCPYSAIDLDDITQACRHQLSGNKNDGLKSPFAMSQIPPVSGTHCERMVDLKMLGGAYTEWCYWLPEQSNKEAVGECRTSEVGRTVTVSNSPAGCGRTSSTTTTKVMQISEGQTGGDWQVMSMGVVPNYDLYRISSAEKFNYDAEVKVTLETGEVFSCTIDPITKSCRLGELGEVKWAGNLVADKGCPDPANDEMIIRNIDTQEWKAVDSSIGSSLASYLVNFNTVKNMNIDYYTFTAIPIANTITSTSISGGGCDPAVGNPIFPIVTAMNTLQKNIPNEKPLIDYNCAVENGNNYVCKSGGSVVYPLLKLTVRASKVGVFVPEGSPKILSAYLENTASSNETLPNIVLQPNKLATLFVDIKNVGSNDDSFDVSLNCPFPLSQQSVRIPIKSQGTGLAELTISGEGLIQNCKVVVNSVSYPSNKDDSDVRVVINPTCDQYGIDFKNMIFTEYGCFALSPYPTVPCTNNEFWLTNLRKCIPKTDIDTGEEKLALLELVGKEDCNRQCNGNKECILACLDMGNVKPVCTGIGKMLSLNDYLCDYENQPNLVMPSQLQNMIWVDAPVCNYVCAYGQTGKDCSEVLSSVKFDPLTRPPQATLQKTTEKCATCFDGIQNQDEKGIDCDGICAVKYGKDKECGKFRSPDHCFNHIQDAGEGGRDCNPDGLVAGEANSCDFQCSEICIDNGGTKDCESFNLGNAFSNNIVLVIIAIVVVIVIGVMIYIKRKMGKGSKGVFK